MTDVFGALRRRLTRIDVMLVGLGLVGLLLYVFLLPAQHPDAAASYALGEAGARQAAAAFLADRGYSVEGLEAEVEPHIAVNLLRSLQETEGRPETLHLLRDEDADLLPAYHWSVTFQRPRRPDGEDGATENGPRYTVRVTAQGTVWGFERRAQGSDAPTVNPASGRVDKQALQAAFSGAPPGLEPAGPPPSLRLVPDSLIAASLSFNPGDTLWQRKPEAEAVVFQGRVVLDELADGIPGGIRLPPSAAVALATYHFRQTSWSGGRFRPDSVWLPAERNNRVARVRFLNADLLHGQRVRVDVEVSVAGALRELDVAFNEGVERQESTLKTVATVLQVSIYVVVVLTLIVLFFKRFAARLIDGKAALIDGLMIGVMAALLVGLNSKLDIDEAISSFWLSLLARLGIMLFSGAGVAVFIMLFSGVTDSLARAAWPKKLRAASLLRLGAFRNIYVGAALLRGLGLAFVLLGLTVGLLALFPRAVLLFDENRMFLDVMSYQPMTMAAAAAGLSTYIVSLFVLLGVGTLVYRLWPKPAPVVGAVILAITLMQAASLGIRPVGYAWALSALWGGVLGLSLWRFDFVTSFVAFFAANLVWSLNEGWLVAGSPVWMDVLLVALFIVGLAVLGLVGVASGKKQQEMTEYVPAYIQDLTQRERLKRELEIARQVQESFLPRRMPDVAGLDIAAMCLPALEVGGDYYDFVEAEPGRLAVVVGDVSGKGTQAAFYMTLTKGILQTLSREGLPPAEVMRRLNALFCANAPRGTFISMIYGVFDVEARTFTFARAGHNPVILKRSPNQEVDLVQPAGLGIGLVSGGVFDDSIEEVTLHLRLGDVLVFYTDGFSEAMNQAKDLYGDDRLARQVGGLGQRSATEILHGISEDVHHFVESAGRHDDMTMVVVKLGRVDVAPAMRQRAAAEA